MVGGRMTGVEISAGGGVDALIRALCRGYIKNAVPNPTHTKNNHGKALSVELAGYLHPQLLTKDIFINDDKNYESNPMSICTNDNIRVTSQRKNLLSTDTIKYTGTIIILIS